jgi:DNA-binding IclR family transcriptional regulator
MMDLAATIVTHDPLLERIEPVLEQLRRETQETVLFAKRQKDQILYLEVLESPQTIRYTAQVGQYKPLHSSCSGKVMLSALSPADLDAWLRKNSLTKVTNATITTRAKLIEDLQKGLRLGYFSTHGEDVPDVTAIAVPVVVNGELHAIAVAGPTHRMDGNYRRHASRLLDAQRTLQKNGIAT